MVRIRWAVPPAAAACTGVAIRLRVVGTSSWMSVDHTTSSLVEASPHRRVEAATTECFVKFLSSGKYEAICTAHNAHGESPPSPVSAPVELLDLQRELPVAPCAPLLEQVANGSIRLRFAVPPTASPCSYMTVKMRVAGQDRWRLYDYARSMLVDAGGSAIPAQVSECLIKGLPSGVYEAACEAKNIHGFGPQSPVSVPVKLEGSDLPAPPDRPVLQTVGHDSIQVNFAAPPAAAPCDFITIQMRSVGAAGWRLVDHSSGSLVERGGNALPASCTMCVVKGLVPGTYEALCQARNAHGWSGPSPLSLPCELLAEADEVECSVGPTTLWHSNSVDGGKVLKATKLAASATPSGGNGGQSGATDEGDIECVGVLSWEERNAELRKQAIDLDDSDQEI